MNRLAALAQEVQPQGNRLAGLRTEVAGPPANDWGYILKGGSFKEIMPVPEQPGYQGFLDTIENPDEFEAEMGATLFLSATLGSDPGVTWGARSQIAEALFRKPIKPTQMLSFARKNEAQMDRYTWGWNKLQRELREEEPPPWWEDVIINRMAAGLANVASGATGFVEQLEQTPMPGKWAPSLPAEAQKKLIAKHRANSKLYWEIAKHPDLVMQRDDAMSKLFGMVAETVPYITATTAASLLIGPVGGFLVGHAVEGNSAYRTALEHDVPEARARRIGAAVGLAAAAIESFGGAATDKLFAAVSEKIMDRGLRAGAKFGFGTVSEALEEAGQEISALTGESTYRDVSWNEAVRRTLMAAGGGAALGGGFHMGRTATRLAMMGEERVGVWRAERQYEAARQQISEQLGVDIETLDSDVETLDGLNSDIDAARAEAEKQAEEALKVADKQAREAPPVPGSASAALTQATGPVEVQPQPEGTPTVGEVGERASAGLPAEAAAPGVVKDFAEVGDVVDGLKVRQGPIPNIDSISASLGQDYEEVGLREIPVSEFTGALGEKTRYSAEGKRRVRELRAEIEESGEITPLIVVQDNEGLYVLEGATRADALADMGKTSFPALLVRDTSAAPAAAAAPGVEGETFYRGSVPGETRRIPTVFQSAEGKTFVARSEKSAKAYGDTIAQYVAKPDAKILREGDAEFGIIAGIEKYDPELDFINQLPDGISLIDLVNRAVSNAEAKGYDAISFRADSDIGTVILNNEAFTPTPVAEGKAVATEKPQETPEAQEKRRRAELGKTTTFIKNHPTYKAELEGLEDQAFSGAGEVRVYVPPEYNSDVEAYAGQKGRERGMWSMITSDPEKGMPWDTFAQERDWPGDFDQVMGKLKEMYEGRTRGAINEKAFERAVASKDIELEVVAMKRNLLGNAENFENINDAIETYVRDVGEIDGMDKADQDAIIETHTIKGPKDVETRKTTGPGVPAKAKADTASPKQSRKAPPTGTSSEVTPAVSRAAQRIQEEAIAKDLTEHLGDLPTYGRMSMARQAKMAAAEIQKDYEQAKRMAYSQIPPPAGLYPASIFRAVAKKAEAEGDVDTLRNLAVVHPGVSLLLSELGKGIKAADVGTLGDPVKAMQSIAKTREKAVKRRTKTKDMGVKKRAMAREAKKEMTKQGQRRQGWTEFVNSIRC